MLVFVDTEFTDFIDCELISLGLVSEDGLHALYFEVQDFDRTKCNAFVQEAVLPQLGKLNHALISKAALPAQLKSWFVSLQSNVTLVSDSAHDRDLIADVFDGEWPHNIDGWFDLRPLAETAVFNEAVARYHVPDKPWHHALHDAHAHRAGWLAWMETKLC